MKNFKSVPNKLHTHPTVRFWWCTRHHGNGTFLLTTRWLSDPSQWKCQTCGYEVEPSAWPTQGDGV